MSEKKKILEERGEVSGPRDVKGQMALNERVAAALGWKSQPTIGRHRRATLQSCVWIREGVTDEDTEVRYSLPDYCNDLNAMHEAEKVILALSDGVPMPDLWDKYYANLQQGASIIIHADAKRRAEAFVKTMEASSDPSGNENQPVALDSPKSASGLISYNKGSAA